MDSHCNEDDASKVHHFERAQKKIRLCIESFALTILAGFESATLATCFVQYCITILMFVTKVAIALLNYMRLYHLSKDEVLL